MKLLLIYCKNFGYTPAHKTLESAEDFSAPIDLQDVQTAFIQLEAQDEENENSVFKKLLKNLKWICGKNNSKKIVLHSFAHLSESKASPEFTKSFFDKMDERLSSSGFEVHQTPFGYFLDLRMDAPGFSLARVFKDL